MEELMNEKVEVLEEGVEAIQENVAENFDLEKYGKYGLVVIGGIGVLTGGYFAYKKVLKPGIRKIKDKFSKDAETSENTEIVD